MEQHDQAEEQCQRREHQAALPGTRPGEGTDRPVDSGAPGAPVRSVRDLLGVCGLRGLCAVDLLPRVWYRHITLAMLAHAFLTPLAAQAAHPETAETNRPASSSSPWRKSDGSWKLSCPTPDPNSTSVSKP
ncbi:hypothetical protein [Streptomyces sp900116325]|uniref:hypothetical protein n=1 Tax=Streptomyces sp. 900116325 TaxID=3154295 RepID=UPI0033ABE7EA